MLCQFQFFEKAKQAAVSYCNGSVRMSFAAMHRNNVQYFKLDFVM